MEIALSELLSFTPINDQVCANLSFEEAIQLQEAMKPALLNCKFQINLTKEHHKLTLVGINDLNIRLYNLLVRDKSNVLSLLQKDGITGLDRKIIRSIKNKPKMKSIIKATYYGDAPALQVLLQNFAKTQQVRTYAKMTAVALEVAVVHSRYDLIKLLVDYGASLDQRIRGYPLLINVLNPGNLKMVEYLLNLGANINISNLPGGITPLDVAFNVNDVSMVKLLLDRGATYSQNNLSLIRSITTRKSVEMLKLLLDYGVDLDNLDSALLHAVMWRQLEQIKLLIEVGANVNYQDESGHSALFYVNHSPTIPLGSAQNVNEQVFWVPDQPEPEILQVLLEAGAVNPN